MLHPEMLARIGNAHFLPWLESKSAMLPRSSFLLSYPLLDCSISLEIIWYIRYYFSKLLAQTML